MKWNELNDQRLVEEIIKESQEQIVLIFKHSTRCSISAMAIDRLTRNWEDREMEIVKPYYLDLIKYRQVSDELASRFGVSHQSPQVLVIKNGHCIYNSSHMGINYSDIKKLTGELSVN